mmetsp:Transcript_25105/g.51285  ORF Transcript_25105/g.51285 Transcript_25105/m.51285 type:complete len:331 (+) Transcript_25105:119-1111(+)
MPKCCDCDKECARKDFSKSQLKKVPGKRRCLRCCDTADADATPTGRIKVANVVTSSIPFNYECYNVAFSNPMDSCWGLGSDENDVAWELVGVGQRQRELGFDLYDRERQADGLVRTVVFTHLNAGHEGDFLNNPCLVILLLKLGCPIPLRNLAYVRKVLTREAESEAWAQKVYPGNSKERQAIVREEIAIIVEAEKNGGSVSGNPVGARCKALVRSGTAPRPYNLENRQPKWRCETCNRHTCEIVKFQSEGCTRYAQECNFQPSVQAAIKDCVAECKVKFRAGEFTNDEGAKLVLARSREYARKLKEKDPTEISNSNSMYGSMGRCRQGT